MSPWDSLLEFLNTLVSPDWGALIALIPLGVAVLVIAYLGWIGRRALTAPPTRTRPAPVAATPAHVHMPGPSLAPFLAAAGFACFFLAILFVHVGPRIDPATKQPIADSTAWTIQPFGLLAIAVGSLALVSGLLYWGREASRDYDALEARTALPAVIAPGPPAGVHVPGPSFRPFMLALAAAAMLLGGVLNVSIFLGGALMLVIALVGWLRDARAEFRETVRADTTGHLENIPAPRFPAGTLLVFGAIFVASILVAAGIVPPRSSAGTVVGSVTPSGAASGASAAGTPAPSAASPAGSAGASGAPGGATGTLLEITASGIAYDTAELTAPAGVPFQVKFTNNDAGIPHNVSIHRDSPTGAEVFKGEIFSGVDSRTYDVPALPAGTYGFVCTVHPTMVGTLTVK